MFWIISVPLNCEPGWPQSLISLWTMINLFVVSCFITIPNALEEAPLTLVPTANELFNVL